MLLSKASVGGVIYKLGDKLRFTKYISKTGYGCLDRLGKNEMVVIAVIKAERSGDNVLFGIVPADGRVIEGWHDLDGNTNKNNGYYIEEVHIVKSFSKQPVDMIVSKNFPFKKKNLKNMKCKVISPMPGSPESLVEFTEDIGGCGADGLGKGGHCLIIPDVALSPVKKIVKTKSKKKKK